MRSAKEQEYFPYNLKTTCYILVYKNADVVHIQHNKTELTRAYEEAISGRATLYAVWPGNWRSDLFIIDDLNAFADAVGVPRKEVHKHTIEWEISDVDDGVSRYAWVDCRIKCGCSLSEIGIKKFANDMKEQNGWLVATSKGWGSHGDVYTVPVARTSLRKK